MNARPPLSEQPAWPHNCLRIPGHEGQPTRIYMQGCGCIYCSQPDPEEQKKIDAVSAETLRREQA